MFRRLHIYNHSALAHCIAANSQKHFLGALNIGALNIVALNIAARNLDAVNAVAVNTCCCQKKFIDNNVAPQSTEETNS
jgi:hypothetical protein